VSDSEIFGDIDFLIPGKISGQRVSKLVNICERRRDCRLAVAPQQSDVINNFSSTVKVSKIIDFFDTLPSSSFMIFCDNYKYIFDKYNNTFRYIPCSADVAGLTLSTLNSWQSPAGVTHGVVQNAIKLAYSAKRSERDLLYSHRVNPIISFPGRGVILNGDKTALASPSAFDRIGVRGLMIELQKVISQFAENQLFEINDDNSRKNFLDNVTPYLQNIQANRGIYEYKIVCDTTNNSVQDIDANKFTADIYIKPARNINFIVLNFIITATGASFTDN
jgi:phage tail sheath protein FI